jgi:hypothetical protein
LNTLTQVVFGIGVAASEQLNLAFISGVALLDSEGFYSVYDTTDRAVRVGLSTTRFTYVDTN